HTRSLRDWSSDVCSSDLAPSPLLSHRARGTVLANPKNHGGPSERQVRLTTTLEGFCMIRTSTRWALSFAVLALIAAGCGSDEKEIGRASGRERVEIWVVA